MIELLREAMNANVSMSGIMFVNVCLFVALIAAVLQKLTDEWRRSR